MKTYDLRSDTFTKPTEGMRKAMYEAEVGDDVYGEDPTVNKLQEMAREITGKESALLISSGCMGNLIPMMIKGGRGKEILTSSYSHIVNHEIGAIASLSGTLPVMVPSEYGIMNAEDVETSIHGYSYDMSETAMIETENTTSGLVYPIDELRRIKNVSEGLGAPAFSILASDGDFIEKAKRCKKILGGGMRQVGILAAAGIYALCNNVERLRDDHEHRALISKALEEAPWADVRISSTNMIFFASDYPMARIIEAMRKRGVLMLAEGRLGRIVLSMGINDDDASEIASLIETIEEGELCG